MTQIPLHLSPRPARTLIERHSHVITALVIIAVAVLVAVLTRGQIVTWHGVEPVVPEVGNCGDYCGTDAGLITG